MAARTLGGEPGSPTKKKRAEGELLSCGSAFAFRGSWLTRLLLLQLLPLFVVGGNSPSTTQRDVDVVVVGEVGGRELDVGSVSLSSFT